MELQEETLMGHWRVFYLVGRSHWLTTKLQMNKKNKEAIRQPYQACLFLSIKFFFYFILLYNTVLVLPYIDVNPPRVYMRSQT